MAISFEQFTQLLADSGLIAADELRVVNYGLPTLHRSDAKQLALALIRQKRLTAYQVQEISKRRGKALSLGNYLILDKLGEGGMGLVLKAQHRRMERVVALKVLSPSVTKTPDALARFQREVKAAARLEHNNIVTAYDADEAGGTHFLVMQYVDGLDLADLVKRHGPLRVDQALDFTLQAARGLDYAHRQGVVHRDIKPANLLLDHEGTIKVLDMGLARIDAAADSSDLTDLTKSSMIMGSVDYMSPEQAVNTRLADAGSDVYSLGCTLWYLLTGRMLYGGETAMEKLMAHREAPIPRLRAARADVPAEVERIFVRMVAKRKEERYATMTEVISEVERIQSKEAHSPPPERLAGEFGRPSEQSDRLMGAAVQGLAREAVTEMVVPISALDATLAMVASGAETDPAAQRKLRGAAQGERPSASRLSRPDPKRRLQAPGFSRKQRLVAWGAGCAGGGALLLAAILLLWPDNRGTVRVEINDPRITAQLDGTGATLSHLDKDPVRLEPGLHRLHVSYEDQGFEVDAFELREGDSVHLSVDLLGDRVSVANGETSLAVRPLTATQKSATKEPAGEPKATWHGWQPDTPPAAIAPFTVAEAKGHQQAWANHLNVPVEYENSIGMKFVLIPPGEFLMGGASDEIAEELDGAGNDESRREQVRSELPQHAVVLTRPIYLGAHEVTQAQYERVMGQNPARFAATGGGAGGKGSAGESESARLPVEQVSWNDAAEFCTKLSEEEKLKPFYRRNGDTMETLDGNGYRLPTEAEWEFACRAGTTTRFWIGDNDESLIKAGWFAKNSSARPHAVGELQANPLGLFDVHGNVLEWVQDWWDSDYYEQFAKERAIDPCSLSSAGSRRVVRGGPWGNHASRCRSSARTALGPTGKMDTVGFRVALEVMGLRDGR